MEWSTLTENLQLYSGFIIALGSFVATLVGFVRPLRKWFVDNFINKNEMGNRITKIETEIGQINEFITGLKDDLYSKFETDRNEQRIMKEATIASTRNDLTAIYNHAIEKGYIGDYDRENFEKMYKVYSDLGGNSYIHEVHDQILKMPTRAAANKRNTRRTSSTRR